MSEMESFEFPEALDPTKTYYPPELFDEREIDTGNQITRFERLDDAEVPVVMAKYMVLKALRLNSTEEMMMGLARGERGEGSFIARVRKIQFSNYDSHDGMTKGDIELAADGLGVYEVIWPFDEEKMQAAIKDEQQLQEALRETALV